MNCVGHYLAISTFYELPYSFCPIYAGPVEQFKILVATSLYCGQNLPPPLSWNRFDIGGKRWLGRIPTVPPVFRRACYTYSFFLLLVHSTSNFKIQWHVEIQKTLTLRLYRVTQVVFSFVKPPFLSSVYKKVYYLFNVYFLCCILLE